MAVYNQQVQFALGALKVCRKDARGTANAISACFKELAVVQDDSGEPTVRLSQVVQLAMMISEALKVPGWIFDGIDQQHELFDFNGDGLLDGNEALRMFNKYLKDRWREFGGEPEVPVPVKTIGEAGYNVVKELGRGGQGVMYLCTKRSWFFSKKNYCVKFYDKANANAGSLEEILDEFELMKNLDNPHLAKTHEIFQDQLFYYLTNVPYFGGDFTKLAQKAYDACVAMNEAWWRDIFKQCLEGLEYLHKSAVIHCDIKEPNIMIADEKYNKPQVVLIDFGLAAAFTSTREGVCGTPGYIPPETWQLERWFPRGDVFSMGIVFFQLMIGQVPNKNVRGVLVPADDSTHALKAAAGQPLPWEQFPQTMPNLQDLIQRMTRKHRKERPKAYQALQHPWFSTNSDAELPSATLQGLVGNANLQVLWRTW